MKPARCGLNFKLQAKNPREWCAPRRRIISSAGVDRACGIRGVAWGSRQRGTL